MVFDITLEQWFSTGFAAGPTFHVGHQVATQHYTKAVYCKEGNKEMYSFYIIMLLIQIILNDDNYLLPQIA